MPKTDPGALRHPDHPIEPLFVRRWSPRAMSGAPLPPAELARLFEAARWAPSTYNEQEWRFRYAHRGGPHWSRFLGLLLPANQVWCKDAAVLVAVCSRHTFARNGKPNPVHSLDCGAALQNLLLQAAAQGLAAHAMAGFDWDRAPGELRLPAEHGVEAMVAIGHPGEASRLPEQLAGLEVPSGRRKIEEFAGEGPFAS